MTREAGTRAFRAIAPIEYGALCDVGRQRQHQEDTAVVLSELGLGMVLDGMGGSSSGNVASEAAACAIADAWADALAVGALWGPSLDDNPLVTAILLGNESILDLSQSNRMYTGIGSTVAAFAATTEGVLVAHVGDSRIYRLRGGKIEPMTRDHSLVNEYISFMPNLNEAEIAALPKNVITRALGMGRECKVDARLEPLRGGDLYLACSDGICNDIDDAQIEGVLALAANLPQAARLLIERANEAGGHDNLSVVLARW